MVLDVSGLFFFMPIFSFLFVFLVVFAILAKTKILGESGFVNVLVSFIIAIIFISLSSLELYVRTITPWFAVLFISVFLILLLSGMAVGKLDWIQKGGFGWFVVGVLLLIFLISAIYVFNPVLHPDLIIAEGGEGVSLVQQIRSYAGGGVVGSILLLIVVILVAWFVTKK